MPCPFLRTTLDLFEGVEMLEGCGNWLPWIGATKIGARCVGCLSMIDGTKTPVLDTPKSLSIAEHNSRVFSNALYTKKSGLLLLAILHVVNDRLIQQLQHTEDVRGAIVVLDDLCTPRGVIPCINQLGRVQSVRFTDEYASFLDFLNDFNDQVNNFD
ncbi:uncharacterized protein LTR77_001999 [Saxophila tyrrhenica]|uniref:Uncharacterized protein n=1 Tax=Saxophila tyrrhenica TaxID=1690608 RepID=A0AAV9PLY8_9PEZI|nr:hypothetical protein LTR77_001999 [Saxophila tyrrhenica]